MINEKNKKKIKIAVTCLIIVLIIWFVILNPLLKFNNMEKKVLEAAERYYEISPKLLPTGEKISTVSLQKLYEKDYISSDLKVPYSSKLCDSKTSWIKVKKDNGEYKYYVYLKCGVFSSNIDHDGPTINLKGEEEITIYKGDKYKDAGIESVIDNTDGKIDIKKVTVDTSKLNTNKNGTYEVTYKIKDSFNNETIKTRKVNVIQTLNNIVKKATDKTNIYKGYNDDNYIKLDGILFKIIGINDDDTVKIATSESISFSNYEGVDSWLNDYFYNKLSDDTKKYIINSKWCNEKISDPSVYKQCKSYSKNKPIGLLSVADINNSKDLNGINNINIVQPILTTNTNSKNKAIEYDGTKYLEKSKKEMFTLKISINLKKDIVISKGNGYSGNPYIIKGTKKSLKAGTEIANAKTGEYVNYSGYTWRIISKEDDNTTKIILNSVLNSDDSNYYTKFSDENKIAYNPNKKNNLGYFISNDSSKYINTKMLSKKDFIINNYKKDIKYKSKTISGKYKIKIAAPSIFDLYSASYVDNYWFSDYSSSSNKACYMNNTGISECSKIDSNDIKAVRLIGYLKNNIKVKSGEGTSNNPYTIAN